MLKLKTFPPLFLSPKGKLACISLDTFFFLFFHFEPEHSLIGCKIYFFNITQHVQKVNLCCLFKLFLLNYSFHTINSHTVIHVSFTVTALINHAFLSDFTDVSVSFSELKKKIVERRTSREITPQSLTVRS